MKVSEYIKLMKKNRPEDIHSNLDNLWEKFYETNEKVLDLLLQTKKITNSQYDRLWLVNETIASDIVLYWIENLEICGIMNIDISTYRIMDVIKSYSPRNKAHFKVLLTKDVVDKTD